MAKWVDHVQNNIFINPPPLPLLCSPTPSTTGSYGRQADRQADEIQVNFEIFKISCELKFLTCASVQNHFSSTNAFHAVGLLDKAYWKVVL